MNDAAAKPADPYWVKPGDTLSSIARGCNKSVDELRRLNKLRNPNVIEAGQTLYLSEHSSFGMSALFLDALRHPVQNLPFQLKFDGQIVTGVTGANGMVPRQTTKSAQSVMDVWARSVEGSWQQIASATSGYGHKLLTLVSGAVVLPGRTELHPTGAPLRPTVTPASPVLKPSPASPQAPRPKPAAGTPSKNNPAVKTKRIKGQQGQPLLKIAVDIPQGLLDHFAKFKGGDITDVEWDAEAGLLGCEPAVLKAFAEVESGGRSSYWRLNEDNGASIPALLYERHYFSRITNHVHDKDHPDVSWPTGFRKKSRLGAKDTKMHDGQVDADDIYSNYASAYLRLLNAYRLDADAALRSCSWGKFQIMGDNSTLCGSLDIKAFVDSMCISELDQIKLVRAFIQLQPASWINPKNKKLGKKISLWDAVKTKDWEAIASNYNGSGYKVFSYDIKLKAAYEKHSAKPVKIG